MKRISILTFLLSSSLNAADISSERYGSSDLYFMNIYGQINEEDGRRFQDLSRNIKRAVVTLDSPGGSVLGGLEIGRSIRSNNYVTAVPNKTLCASSCALIWLAGAKRFAEEGSFIGFHAAFIYKNGKPVETGSGNALIGAYLNQIGLSDKAIIFITNAPPEGIARLDKSLSQQYGILYTSVDDNIKKDLETLRKIKPAPDAPFEVVRKFYIALSRADGDTAAALVTPSKRGIGSFNEKNMAIFYGNMKEPLQILSVQKVDDATFKVMYTYRVTKAQCNGIAIVETENLLGNTLIKKISANC